jgi:peptidyl-prolyl cis-trans isomerase SurA
MQSMCKPKRLCWVCFTVLAGLVVSISPVAAETCNRIVAVVNSDVITLYELNSRIKQMTGLDPDQLKARDESRYIESRRAMLDLLIDEKLAQEKIQELGIRVTPSQVDAAIERIKRNSNWTQEDLKARLEQEGSDYEAFRQRIRDQLERMRLINEEVQSKIVIREEELKEYYETHKSEFVKLAEVHIAAIVLLPKNPPSAAEREALLQRADDLVSRIRAGEDFASLARRFSQGPGAQEGGDLGFFELSVLDPELAEIVKDMSPGSVADPILRDGAVHIIKLLERQEGKQQPYEEVRDALHDRFYQEEVNKRYSVWIQELRETAYTKIIF